MKDAFGKEIQLKDTVIYMTRRGSSQEMIVGKVEKIVKTNDYRGERFRAYIRAQKSTASYFSPRDVIVSTPGNLIILNDRDWLRLQDV